MQKVSRKNNFDFIRILLSLLVILSHSYPLTGIRQEEPLRVLSNNQIDFGGLAVKIFFIISGYLIFQSVYRSISFPNYLWKRILRLFPALIVMLLITLCVVPFIYSGSISIFNQLSYWTYFPRQLSLYDLQNSISGVFTTLPYNTVNGSLWTLSYEFTMYLIFGLFY